MASRNDVEKSLDKLRKIADRKSHRSTGIRKSDRLLKRGVVVKKVSCFKDEVKETSEMGASTSKDCGDLAKENDHLKTRIKLYEAGISDLSVHGSQTNIGLLNLSSESNSGTCSCPAAGGLSTIEITLILMLTLLSLYVVYGWCSRYNTHRKEEKVRQETKLMERMRRNMEKEETRLEMVACEKDNGFRS